MEIVLRSFRRVHVSDKSKWVEIVNYSLGRRGLSLKVRVAQERGGRGQLWPLHLAVSQRRC